MLMGSVAEHVVREAGCPVMVVRPKSYPDIKLDKIVEVVPQHHAHRVHGFSYSNNQVIMRPPNWPIH